MTARKKRVVGDPKVAVAYLRVSTEDQNLGPEAQRAAITAWAAREGVSVAVWHEDHGISGGAKVADRPALLAAVGALREHNAGVLVVAKRDRLARDVVAARAIAELCVKAGACVRSADGISDVDGPEGVILKTMIDAFAEYERVLIGSRTKAALAAKRVRGEAVGRPPFGFRTGENGVLLPDDVEQAALATLVRLVRDDATERAIVETLAQEGVQSRSGKPLGQTQVHRLVDRLRERCASRTRLVQREIVPLDGAVIDVDLYDVLVPWGADQGWWREVEPILDRIERGEVSLKVVSLRHRLPPGWRDRRGEVAKACSGASPQHRGLCALGYMWLEALGRKPFTHDASMHPRLQHAGGYADVVAGDGSVFIECGPVGRGKVEAALQAREKVMVIPYGLGGRVGADVLERLIDQDHARSLAEGMYRPPETPEPTEELADGGPCSRDEAFEIARGYAIDEIALGYLFSAKRGG